MDRNINKTEFEYCFGRQLVILTVARIGFGDLVLEEAINQAEKCIEKGNGEGVAKVVRLLRWGFA